jgi:hypothetical protein
LICDKNSSLFQKASAILSKSLSGIRKQRSIKSLIGRVSGIFCSNNNVASRNESAESVQTRVAGFTTTFPSLYAK